MQANCDGLPDVGSVIAEIVKISVPINRLRMIRMEINFFIVICLPFLFGSGVIY